MGKGKDGGILENKWTTVILVIVLIALAVIVYWVMKTGGLEGCRKKPKPAPPGKLTMLKDYKPIDSMFTVNDDLSWKRLA